MRLQFACECGCNLLVDGAATNLPYGRRVGPHEEDDGHGSHGVGEHDDEGIPAQVLQFLIVGWCAERAPVGCDVVVGFHGACLEGKLRRRQAAHEREHYAPKC